MVGGLVKMTTMNDLRKLARELDQQDPLRSFRDRFVLHDPELCYLDGNSLGRQPQAAREMFERLASQWGERLIRGWNDGWMDLPQRLGNKIATILGAAYDSVRVADSTTVNLYKLSLAALRVAGNRKHILTDDLNFPSDHHALQSALHACSGRGELHVVRSQDGCQVDEDALINSITAETALVVLSHVAFKSGFAYDLARVTRRVRERGATLLWDLSHSVGAMPIECQAHGVDLAVGCTYKYLNGGPGAPAFLYVHPEWQARLQNPIAGWLGHAHPFDFQLDYVPAEGVQRFVTGTPPVLSLAMIEPGLDLTLEAGIQRIRAKSTRQSEFVMEGFDRELRSRGFEMITPREAAQRGSHVSLGHPEAWRINQALIQRFQVIPDFRRPRWLRLGIAPLYNSFQELLTALERLIHVIDSKCYLEFPAEMEGVT